MIILLPLLHRYFLCTIIISVVPTASSTWLSPFHSHSSHDNVVFLFTVVFIAFKPLFHSWITEQHQRHTNIFCYQSLTLAYLTRKSRDNLKKKKNCWNLKLKTTCYGAENKNQTYGWSCCFFFNKLNPLNGSMFFFKYCINKETKYAHTCFKQLSGCFLDLFSYLNYFFSRIRWFTKDTLMLWPSGMR